MKNKLAKFIIIILIILNSYAFADTIDKAQIEKYYLNFSHKTDGTGMLIRNSHFAKELPVEKQTEVLDLILDRAIAENPQNNNAIAAVLEYVDGYLGDSTIWSSHLEKAIYAQANNTDWEVRDLFVTVLLHKQKDKAKDIILSFQNDPDDRVRCTVLNAITEWPEAKSVYEKYIQNHENDPNYAKSMWYAKACLEIVNREQAAAQTNAASSVISNPATSNLPPVASNSPPASETILAPTPAPKPVPTPTPAAQIVVTETTPPLWLYAIIILSAAFLIGSWLFLRAKNKTDKR